MEPIILLANDFHIDKDNVLDFEENWNEMLEVCYDNDIHHILIGGDIFTNRNAQTLAPMLMVQKCLRRAGANRIRVSIAPGNHDKTNQDVTESWCDLYSDIPCVEVISTYKIYDLGECFLAMFAYYPEQGETLKSYMEGCRQVLTAEFLSSETNCIAYVHAGIHGALGDFDVPSEAPQELFDGFKAVLCGHYHNQTHIKDTDIYYIGSSRAHNFGEDEEKGYTLIYPNGKWEFVKNEANTRYVTEELTLKELTDWQRTYGDDYKVRLKITCTAAEAETVDRQDLLDRGANKIEFVTEKIQAVAAEASDIEDKFNNADLQQEYQVFCKDKEIDSKMGIEYLQKTK